MASTAALALVYSKFPIASTKSQVCQLRNHFLINMRKQQHVPITCSVKFPTMEDFSDPTKRVSTFWNCTQGELWKRIPGSFKDFPWKKAESVALHGLMVLGKETLKWSLLACFMISFLSDIPYSIVRNKELVIPVGLFVGSLVAKYFDEILQELLHRHKDGRATWRLLGISCFFVIVKVISTYFPGGNDFLLFAGNGGLMQVVWDWKDLPKQDGEESLLEDVSMPMNADN